MLIGEVYGVTSYNVVKSISSAGKSIFIDFTQADGQFVATIKYNKKNPDCQSWLDSNMLMSPNNPTINCSWIITRKFGSYISLDFKFIEVKLMNIMVNLNSNYISLYID